MSAGPDEDEARPRAKVPGIRRRKPPEPEGAAEPRRRRTGSTTGRAEERRKAAGRGRGPQAGGDGPVGRPFGNDWTAVLLANFFRMRPDMPFDWSLLEKDRTHGYYYGAGGSSRRVTLGFQPIHVLYLMPFFPQLPKGGWPPSDRSGRLKDPGPHEQPALLEDGFEVDATFDYPGEYYSFVAWRDAPYVPGEPLRLPAPPHGSP